MKTAEWLCTSCGTTNRKLVQDSETKIQDRCVRCHMRHSVEEETRPVRWGSAARS